eukprot:6192873-Pleurochrysis_carterae.AAC.1
MQPRPEMQDSWSEAGPYAALLSMSMIRANRRTARHACTCPVVRRSTASSAIDGSPRSACATWRRRLTRRAARAFFARPRQQARRP